VIETTVVNPMGEFPAPVPIPEAAERFAKMDAYVPSEVDQSDMNRQFPQLKGLFLIDREGIVRWTYIECGAEGPAGIGNFPSEHELLAAARALPR
jgi:hypothetical protein